MNIQAFLQPLGGAGFQIGMTLFLLVSSILLLSRSVVGKDLLMGILKETQHDGTLKFSMGRFLLMFVIIIWATLIVSFKNAAYTPLLKDPGFLPAIDNIEGYAYKVVDFFLALIFGNKVINGAISIFKKDDSKGNSGQPG